MTQNTNLTYQNSAKLYQNLSTNVCSNPISSRPQLIRHTTLQNVCQGCCTFLNSDELKNEWCVKCQTSDNQKFREMDYSDKNKPLFI